MSERAARFWDAQHAAGAADSFLEHPLIQLAMSLRAFGSGRPHLDVAIDEIAARTRPGARILSVGCGPAAKERAICRALPDRTIVGIDLAAATLAAAARAAQDEGIANLELARADFNALALEPRSFDMVLGLGAIHHVENLEGLWAQCRRALRPGGCVLAQEYVGPSRFQWTAAQIEHGDRALRTIVPPQLQVHHRTVQPIAVAALVAVDPSEAIRSAEIVSTCRAAGFVLESYRGGGGGLLQPVLMHQTHAFDPRDWDHNYVLFALLAEEDRLLRDGVVGDAYAMFVARP